MAGINQEENAWNEPPRMSPYRLCHFPLAIERRNQFCDRWPYVKLLTKGGFEKQFGVEIGIFYYYG
jgi:hypothetical protein